MEFLKDKNRRKGVIGVIMIHVLLLLAFLLLGLSYEMPPPPGPQISINFGNSAVGSGNTEEIPSSTNEAVTNTEEQTVSESSEAQIDEVVTQNTTETITVPKSDKSKEKTENSEAKEPEPTPSDALNKARQKIKNRSDNSEGDGPDDDPGNIGDPDGTDGDGTGGTGTDMAQNGDKSIGRYRKFLARPSPRDDCPSSGNTESIVIDFVVDRSGKVIRTSTSLKSTTTDPCLVQRSIEAAKQIRWNKDPNAAPEQRGYVTYIFEPK